MISMIVGSVFLVLGSVIIWNLVKGSGSVRRKRGTDPNFFKSLEIAVVEKPTSNAWAASASFQKRNPDPLDFDFGEELDEVVKPIGLSTPGPLDLPDGDAVKKSIPPKGIGFVEPDEDEEGPTQETLGF